MAASPSNLLLSDFASHARYLPSKYIRPASDRPYLTAVKTSSEAIPVIDLTDLDGPDRHKTVAEIGVACKNAGFFQVPNKFLHNLLHNINEFNKLSIIEQLTNHGIPEEVIAGMLRASRDFFRLPESERLKNYSDDTSKTTRLSTSFNVTTENISSWRDYLRLHCHPVQDFIHEWPSNPPSFKPAVATYATCIRQLVLRLLRAISESLGLDSGYMERALGRHEQHMAVNYYPPCPEPELTYGLPGHKDPNAITILLQDGVAGLQVRREGKWVAVAAVAGTLVVNVGDQMQVLSNGRYESVLHRAVVNRETERVSVPTFYCSSPEDVVEAAEELVNEEHPRLYRRFTYGEYYETFWRRGLKTESCLELFRETN